MKRLFPAVFWVVLLSSMLPASLPAQGGFYLSPGKTEVEIPFEYDNNFIIVTLLFNGRLPLRFIFDTGAEHTILTKRELADVLGVSFDREFHIVGSDLKTEMVAYLARSIRLEVPEKLLAPRVDMLVLKEDYFRFEEYAGVNVHGVLAASIFSRFLIKINYQRKVITLFDRENPPKLDAAFQPLDLELFRNKLYLNTQLAVRPDSALAVKLLLDTGAGLPLLLFTNTNAHLRPPPTARAGNIGIGLGGYLSGYLGRVARVQMGPFEQSNIVSQFQEIDTSAQRERSFLNNRNGLIGNVLLSRFQIILDYQEEKMWLKPTKKYRRAFDYDRSGLSLLVSGSNLSRFTVQHVMPDSPASDAGLRPGDQLLSIRRIPAGLMNLEDVLRYFERKPGTKIRLAVRRDGQRFVQNMVLRELY